MEQNIVICINREYGSGGRTIGEMLSKDLGYHYYDKEILKLASDDSGINEALFDAIGDNILDCDNDTLSLVEDYREDLVSLLGGSPE